MQSRSKSTAKETRQALSKRHKSTSEVKDVLTGASYKKVNPKYVSKPNIDKCEVQHQHLYHQHAMSKPEAGKHDFDDYAKQDVNNLYGKVANLRHLDPAMDEILAWGRCDPPVKNDFTTNK